MKPTIGAMEDDCEDDRDEFFDAISTPDSDTDSIFSDSEDLKEVLSEALRTDAPFTGSHHYCLTEQSAPNPFLRVAGLGPLELPLSEGDARSIASVASPVRAAEDQTANNVWEVGPSDLMVEGAAWQGYLNNAVLPSVSDELGFSSFTNSKARIELSKLMLFGPGSSSDSLFHRTQEAANEFGKLAVFLRSAFEGGQIRLSSTGENDAVKIDVSSVSKTSTTFIAWYNDDVVSRIMPVTSGYQLVLVYCLVHTGSPFTEPTLRYATDRSTFLGHVLTRWREKDYQHLPSVPLLVLPLSKAYEPQSLKDGTDTLEDLDAETVASLLPVAQNHSFSVCLANFVPSALETGQQAYIVFNFVRIKDASDPDRTLYLKELGIPHDALTCDEANGETYADRSVRTGLVIFQDQDELDIAILHQGAEQTLKSLTTREPLRPTARNRQLARAALKSLGKIGQQGHDASGRGMSVMLLSVVENLLYCAVSWKDVKLWNDVLQNAHGLPLPLVLSACRMASQHLVHRLLRIGAHPINPPLVGMISDRETNTSSRKSVYDLIIRISNISGRLMLIEAIVPLLPNDEVGLSWANGAVGVVLSSYRDGKVEDIPTLLDLAAQHGLAPIHEKSVIFPRSVRPPGSDLAYPSRVISNVSESAVPSPDAFNFLLELMKEIHRKSDAFSAPSKSTARRHTPTPVGKIIRSCIMAVISIISKDFKLPEDVLRSKEREEEDQPCPSSLESAFKIDQLCEIFELCLTVNDSVPCQFLLNSFREFLDSVVGSVIKRQWDRYYSGALRTVLQGRHLRLPAYVFQLSEKSPQAPIASERIEIGCKNIEDCYPCQTFEAFVNSRWTEHRFEMDKIRRTHLEWQIDIFLRVNEYIPPNGPLTCETLKHSNPHVLVVKKNSRLLQVPDHEEIKRQMRSKTVYELLKSFGRDGTLDDAKNIMGDSWDDVVKACEGGEPFQFASEPKPKEDRAKGKEKEKVEVGVRRRPSTCSLGLKVKKEASWTGGKRKSSTSASG